MEYKELSFFQIDIWKKCLKEVFEKNICVMLPKFSKEFQKKQNSLVSFLK